MGSINLKSKVKSFWEEWSWFLYLKTHRGFWMMISIMAQNSRTYWTVAVSFLIPFLRMSNWTIILWKQTRGRCCQTMFSSQLFGVPFPTQPFLSELFHLKVSVTIHGCLPTGVLKRTTFLQFEWMMMWRHRGIPVQKTWDFGGCWNISKNIQTYSQILYIYIIFIYIYVIVWSN